MLHRVSVWAAEWKDFRLDHPGLGRVWSAFLLLLLLVAAYFYLRSLGPVRPEDNALIQSSQGVAQFLINDLAALLALTPTLLAFGAFALGRKRESIVRHDTVVRYLKFRRALANLRSDGQTFFIEASLLDDLVAPKSQAHRAREESGAKAAVRPSRKARLDDALGIHRPRPSEYLFSAVLLSAPFIALAALSDMVFDHRGYLPALETSASVHQKLLEQGIRGIVFTGYGVFTYTLVVLIQRIHAGALSTEFLLGATLRAALMMVIGFALGVTGIFSRDNNAVTSGFGVFIYFVVGAFPAWGYEALRGKAREFLKPKAQGTSNLSLEYIDGMDDPTLDRLDELGISNVQHLSTVDPVDLMLRTQISFFRIIDWIDQAILITYLREKISEARPLGIRGAIDLVGVYKKARGLRAGRRPWPVKARSDGLRRTGRSKSAQVLKELATRSQLGSAAIENICENLVDDFHVQLLWTLWHHRGVPQPRLRARYVVAITRALERSGQPFDVPPQEGVIPEGECRLPPSGFLRLKRHLKDELGTLGLRAEWKGKARELQHLRRLEDLYGSILEEISVTPSAPRSGGARRWRFWRQEAHA